MLKLGVTIWLHVLIEMKKRKQDGIMVGDYFCSNCLCQKEYHDKKDETNPDDERYVICDISKLVLWKRQKKLYNNIDEIIIDVDKRENLFHYFNNNHFVYEKTHFIK